MEKLFQLTSIGYTGMSESVTITYEEALKIGKNVWSEKEINDMKTDSVLKSSCFILERVN
jgi:hypothetical protein